MAIPLEERLRVATHYLQSVLMIRAPKDSWNLTLNAILIVQIAPNHFRIVIGGEVAPYAPATNGPWESPRWKGRVNPNQGWVDNAIAEAKPMIASLMSGEIDAKELESAIDINVEQLSERMREEAVVMEAKT